jgi:phosphohistidine swiveling domain-containing protein
MDIVKKFTEGIRGGTLYTPVYNFTPLNASLGWYDAKYYQALYNEYPQFPIFSLAHGGATVWYLTIEHLRPIAKEFFLDYYRNPEKVHVVLEAYNSHKVIVDECYDVLTEEFLVSANEEELLKLLKKIVEAEKYTNAAGWFSVYSDREYFESVIRELGISLHPEQIYTLLERGVVLVLGSFDVRSTEVILRMISEGKSLIQVATKMQYVFSGFHGSVSVEQAKELILKDYGDYFNNKALLHEKILLIAKEREEMLTSFSRWYTLLSPEERKLVEYIQLSSRVKDELRDYVAKAVSVIYRIGWRLLEASGIEAECLPFCLYNEICKGSKSLTLIHENIQKRKNGFGFVLFPDTKPEMSLLDFESVRVKLEKIYLEKNGLLTEGVDTINGQVASRGKVVGRVRRVMDIYQDASKMGKGDILVTGMTRPEFVPLMNLAAAIVTDEGGITSHAAIVSRELRKPCIIGTKIATQVLRDGDLVEVDADAGVVRVIERAK